MSKETMIEMICTTNRSARPEFLVHFKEEVLQSYLRRLSSLHNHRGRHSVWVRPAGSPVVVTRAASSPQWA